MFKLRLQAHVLYYGSIFALSTGAALLFARVYSQSDTEKRLMLEKKFPDEHRERKKKELQAFFDKMKEAQSTKKSNDEQEKQFESILKGGRGDVKRQQTYDKPKP